MLYKAEERADVSAHDVFCLVNKNISQSERKLRFMEEHSNNVKPADRIDEMPPKAPYVAIRKNEQTYQLPIFALYFYCTYCHPFFSGVHLSDINTIIIRFL